MRIRTMVTFVTGAAVGAGALYLLDPDHGAQRRRQARRQATAQVRHAARSAVHDGRRWAVEAAAAAASGYREARETPGGH